MWKYSTRGKILKIYKTRIKVGSSPIEKININTKDKSFVFGSQSQFWLNWSCETTLLRRGHYSPLWHMYLDKNTDLSAETFFPSFEGKSRKEQQWCGNGHKGQCAQPALNQISFCFVCRGETNKFELFSSWLIIGFVSNQNNLSCLKK